MKKKTIISLFLLFLIGAGIVFTPKLYADYRYSSIRKKEQAAISDLKTEEEQLLALVEYRAQIPFEDLLDDMNFMLKNDFKFEGFIFHGMSLALIREEIGPERFREEINNEENHPKLIMLLKEVDEHPNGPLNDYYGLKAAVNGEQSEEE